MAIKKWDAPQFKFEQLLSADDILELLLSMRDDVLADIICEALARNNKVLEIVKQFVNS